MARGPVTAGSSRLDSLTGARFVAAALVFVFHVATVGIFAGGTADVLTALTKSAGTIGVSFFFVLSGFVLTWSMRPGDRHGSFLRRRLVKIYPNHLVTFALAMLLLAAATTPPATALLNALLLQSWVPDPQVFLSVNGSSWSLSCELLFYALFPVLAALVRRIPPARLWAWAAAVAVLVMVLPLLVRLVPAGEVFDPAIYGKGLGGESVIRMWLLYIFPPVRLLDFVLGILMARIVLSGNWIGLGRRWCLLLAVIGYVIGLGTPWLYTVDAVTVVPLALLVSSIAAAESAGASSILAGKRMRRLGDASFAFYLVHGILLVYLRQAIGEQRQLSVPEGALFALGAFVLSVVASLALHRFVEVPAMRRWSRPRRPPAIAAATPVVEAPPS